MQESSILQLSLYQLLARVALLAVLAMPWVRVARVALQARFAMPRERVALLARMALLELLARLALLLGILMHLLQAGGLLCLVGCRVRHRLGGVWDLR